MSIIINIDLLNALIGVIIGILIAKAFLVSIKRGNF